MFARLSSIWVQCGNFSPRIRAREQKFRRELRLARTFGEKISAGHCARRESPGADSLIFCSILVRAYHLRGNL
jgi:hypothetical protein